MASIGRFTTSFMSGTQEITAGLANINFDFSMVKVTAPPEYNTLGKLLSPKRKSNAEEGSLHRTARKLGALFQEDLPQVSALVKAYGRRASEIAEHPLSNSDTTIKHGALDDYLGFDGSTIWAAATSGSNALQSHLLGCIIARAWPQSRAFAIWREFVDVRKAMLTEKLNGDTFTINTLTAAQLNFSDNELSDWDASARSWLQMADKVKLHQRKQLMLIIDNLGMTMQQSQDLYKSVFAIWIESLAALDQLVSGQPLLVRNPNILLGLSAWHLFPDIIYTGHEEILIEQKDHLVAKGGLLTVGIKTTNPKHEGITWTLPLAHLHYYGKPRSTAGIVATASAEVPLDTFLSVVFGSAISQWGMLASNLDLVAQLMTIIDKRAREIGLLSDRSCDWPALFAEVAKNYLQGTAQYRTEFERSVALGRRRFAKFLAPVEVHPPPAFGLTDLNNIVDHMSTEQVIALFRHFASPDCNCAVQFDLRNAFLVHKLPKEGESASAYTRVEIVTLTPDSDPKSSRPKHRRWILLRNSASRQHLKASDLSTQTHDVLNMGSLDRVVETNPRKYKRHEDDMLDVPSCRVLQLRMNGTPTDVSSASFHVLDVRHSLNVMESLHELCGFATYHNKTKFLQADLHFQTIECDIENTVKYMKGLHELSDINWGMIDISDVATSWCSQSPMGTGAVYQRLPLNSQRFSVFVQRPPPGQSSEETPHLSLACLNRWLDGPSIRKEVVENITKLSPGLVGLPGTSFAGIGKRASWYQFSLEIVHEIARLYKTMPHASIKLSVLEKPIWEARWVSSKLLERDIGAQRPCMTRSQALACITMMATGQLDLEARMFENVIAASIVGNLYISELLLNDPLDCTYNLPLADGIRCLTGNIGKPGTCLLISTDSPEVCQPDLNEWKLINHRPFDGHIEDNFRSTSLHLSLTGYDTPIDTGEHGIRGKEVFYVETVISVYEHGTWVGDLSVLPMYKGVIRIPQLLEKCDLHSEKEVRQIIDSVDLRSVDNWAEFLDRPMTAFVVRANGNWVARLALAATAFARKETLFVSNGDTCWKCLYHETAKNWNNVMVLM